MSNVELTSAELTSARPAARTDGPESVGSVRANLRFFANELRVTFFRRRNQLLLLVAALFPLLIGIGLKAAAPHGGGGGNGPSSGGAAFFNQLAGNGVFLSFIALSLLLILVLPVVVAVVAGDSIAGEAGY